jgi:hypothetical protein
MAMAAAIWLDNRIKSQAPLYGHCPADADAILYSSDFGTFWGQALNTEQVQRIRGDWRRAGSGLELTIRRLTGIRPTPSRWRLWMGQRFLASNTPHGYGVCTYPGLLLRSASKVHSWMTDPIDASGVRAYGDIFFAWREGFLIASLDAEYVRASLQSDGVAMNPGTLSHAIVFESRTSPIVSLEIRAEDEFPIYGRLPSTVSDRTAPMTLPNAWHSPPMAACSATAWKDIASLLTVADDALSHSEWWADLRSVNSTLFTKWNLDTPPPEWQDDRLDHCSLVLQGIDVTSNVSYPEMAFVVRSTLPAIGKHPLLDLLPADIEGIPYEWEGNAGTLYPMVGSQWAPCLGYKGRDWIGASRERVMRALVEDLGEGAAVPADFTLQVDWEQVSEAIVHMLTQVEDLELFPEMNREEVRTNLVPIAKALRHLGRTEILGEQIDGTNTIEGRLTRRPRDFTP